MDRPITKKEVATAIRKKKFVKEPILLDILHDAVEPTRSRHIERIAYLVENYDGVPILLDVGEPSLGCTVPWLIEDGNHRLAAAFYRKEKTILALVLGNIDYAKEILGNCKLGR